MLLQRWRERLAGSVAERFQELTSSCPDPMPQDLRSAILDALEQQDCDRGLLSCAAAAHCGADPEVGLLPGVSVIMLEAALASHLPVVGLGGGNSLLLDYGEATALLVGDALIPLALENLCGTGSRGDRHAPVLVADAIRALGARGALDRMSLEVEEKDPDVLERLRLSGGEMPVTLRECFGRFSAAAGARMAPAHDQTGLDEMSMFGFEVGRASGLAGLSERMCRLFGLSHEDLEGEAVALVSKAASRISDSPCDSLARLLVESALEPGSQSDLLENA
ncbi:hypothetical protein JW921_09330 [Candidatus Fermentibacterales bacterium]|nr:hypothetical protein [Candidatus Fermentibacterales bacterium]